MLDLHGEGRLPQRGFCRQEDVSLDVFLANRFGRLYAGGIAGGMDDGRHTPLVAAA
jgi:hypothetical protein